MSVVDPIFSYLTILSVIQPARIQDIESSAADFLGPDLAKYLIEGDHLRNAHETARERGWVTQVRRGVYFLAPQARQIVRRSGLERSMDNRRIFLMKYQRKRYK